MTISKNRINILLIQNQSDTLHSVQRALEANKTHCRLQMVGTGSTTLSYLRRDDPYANAPVPDLVLFDLTSAAPAAISVVRAIKADQHCQSLPMVLLTSDDSEEALVKLVSKRENDTAFSPIDLDNFVKALNSFKPDRFMHSVRLLENFGYVLIRMPDSAEEAILSQAAEFPRAANL